MLTSRSFSNSKGVSLFIFFSPPSSVAASLFPEFLGAFHRNSSSAVFELLDDYQALCQDKVGPAAGFFGCLEPMGWLVGATLKHPAPPPNLFCTMLK